MRRPTRERSACAVRTRPPRPGPARVGKRRSSCFTGCRLSSRGYFSALCNYHSYVTSTSSAGRIMHRLLRWRTDGLGGLQLSQQQLLQVLESLDGVSRMPERWSATLGTHRDGPLVLSPTWSPGHCFVAVRAKQLVVEADTELEDVLERTGLPRVGHKLRVDAECFAARHATYSLCRVSSTTGILGVVVEIAAHGSADVLDSCEVSLRAAAKDAAGAFEAVDSPHDWPRLPAQSPQARRAVALVLALSHYMRKPPPGPGLEEQLFE